MQYNNVPPNGYPVNYELSQVGERINPLQNPEQYPYNPYGGGIPPQHHTIPHNNYQPPQTQYPMGQMAQPQFVSPQVIIIGY